MPFPNDLDIVSPAPDDLVGNQQAADPILAALLASGSPLVGSPPGAAPLVQTYAADAPPGQAPIVSMQAAGEGGTGGTGGPPTVQPLGGGQGSTVGTPAGVAPAGQVPALEPLKPGDVAGATTAQNSAINQEAGNIQAAELAKVDALSEHAERRAKVHEGHATAQGLLDQQYQSARASARKDADTETAAWMRDLDKKVAEEPVPGRWFANQSAFSKVMYIASLAFGALAQSKNGNLKNIALEMITQEMHDDVEQQKDKLKRQVDALKARGERMDRKTAERLADSRDDHAMMVARLAIIQQAAVERAAAPGPADQKAAMAEVAQWAGQQRLNIAGERSNRAYLEREGKLNREQEMARAMMTDKRERDLKAAEIQKDYDLAKISAGVKLAKDDPRFKDAAVLHPDITGIRVVDATTGKPVVNALSQSGGMVYNTKREGLDKALRDDAELAQDHYATLARISKALSGDEDLTVLLKRNPQLVADIQKIGYQTSKENDPRAIVTDKDLIAGMETGLGGDLSSLSGRVASATFSAGQAEIKKVVDKALRDMPEKLSKKFGSKLDASIPGYEGNIRVDWTPKAVEIAEPGSQTTQQIDASYGIKTPVKAPETLKDLESAQALEKKGVQSLPPYRPGSQDKVLKALEDFKGAMPETIISRAGAVEKQLRESGDTRAELEVQQAQYAEVKKANKRLSDVEEALQYFSAGRPHIDPEAKVYKDLSPAQKRAYLDNREVPVSAVVTVAKAHGITQLTGEDVLAIIKKAGLKPGKE